MTIINLLIGFLILFLLYQLAEANGQDLLKFPSKPYSMLRVCFAASLSYTEIRFNKPTCAERNSKKVCT